MEGTKAAVSARKRKHTKLSIDDAIAALETTAKGLEMSFRLTDIQEAAIQKCFQLIQTNSDDLQASVRSQKSTRPMTVYRILHDIRFLLGLKLFLLCALALPPTRMQTMGKDEAAMFPSKLQDWWNASTPPSTKLEALARQFEPFDKTIPYIAPDIQLCEPSKHSEPSAQLASHPTINPGYALLPSTHSIFRPTAMEILKILRYERQFWTESTLVLPNVDQPYLILPVSYESGSAIIRERLK